MKTLHSQVSCNIYWLIRKSWNSWKSVFSCLCLSGMVLGEIEYGLIMLIFWRWLLIFLGVVSCNTILMTIKELLIVHTCIQKPVHTMNTGYIGYIMLTNSGKLSTKEVLYLFRSEPVYDSWHGLVQICFMKSNNY